MFNRKSIAQFLLIFLNLHLVNSAFPLSEIVPPLGKILVFSGPNKTELLTEIFDQPTIYSVLDAPQDVEGYIYTAMHSDSCVFLPPPPVLDDDFQFVDLDWILLVSKRTNCKTDELSKAFTETGIIAVIMYNVESNATEVLPKFDDVPLVFVGESDGWLLRDNFSFPRAGYVKIEGADLFWGKFRAYGVWTASSIGILAMGTFLIYLVVRVAKYSVRYGRSCGVCHELLPREDGNSMLARLYVLPCSHKFHAFCMMPYASPTGMTCPICSRCFHFDSHASTSGEERAPTTPADIVDPNKGMNTMITVSPYTPSHPNPTPERVTHMITTTRVELHDETGPGIISSQIETIGTENETDSERQPLLSAEEKASS